MLYDVAKPSSAIPPIHKYHPNDQMAKITLKCPKITQNCQKLPKIAQNGLKCLGKWPNEARNTNTKLPDIKWRKIAKKKLPQNRQHDPKMAKNDPKWS